MVGRISTKKKLLAEKKIWSGWFALSVSLLAMPNVMMAEVNPWLEECTQYAQAASIAPVDLDRYLKNCMEDMQATETRHQQKTDHVAVTTAQPSEKKPSPPPPPAKP